MATLGRVIISLTAGVLTFVLSLAAWGKIAEGFHTTIRFDGALWMSGVLAVVIFVVVLVELAIQKGDRA